MKNLMRQAKKMQDEITKAQNKLGDKIVQGSAGSGAVQVEMNCKNELINLKINKSVIDPDDDDVLIELIVTAFNEAHDKITKATEEELSKITGGLIIPDKIKIKIKED